MKALEVCKITTPLEAAEVWLEKSATITASSDRDISRRDIKQTERQKYQQKRYKNRQNRRRYGENGRAV